MDGNSTKNAPVLSHLVGTSNNQTDNMPKPNVQSKPVLTTMNGKNPAPSQNRNSSQQTRSTTAQGTPQNRRTDKSQFEIELAETVNRIMHKHFEHASAEIVQQVLSEVRARLPGQRKP